MLEVNNIYNMDCIEGLRKLPNKCIDMAITSPPYFKLRDYGVVGQIGQENTCDEYINNLVSVFNEVYRVLKDNGSCWVNIDDVYNNQSLMCIPDKFKIKMIENGWICRNEIIWHKPNSMPSSAKTRFNNDYEKMFFFTKTNDYYFETQYEPFKSTCSKNTQIRKGKSKYSDEEQEKSVRQGMSKNRGSKIIEVRKHLPTQDKFVTFMRSRTSVEQLSANSDIRKTKIEHWFRKDKCGFSYPCVDDWNKIKHLVDDFSEEFMEIDFGITQVDYETDDILKNADKGRIKRAVWSINTKAFKGGHFASYPEELVDTPIKACCPIGGVVLDTFMGSGTTAVTCIKNDRKYIGFELSKEYCGIAQDRIEQVQNDGLIV